MIVLRYPGGPGKLNLVGRGAHGCHSFTDQRGEALLFADDAEAQAYVDAHKWLASMQRHGDIVKEPA